MSGPALARDLRGSGRACLTLLAALLPFEMTDPIARVGPLQISSVELFLYLALAVWGMSVLAGWFSGDRDLRALWRRVPREHRAVAVWALVLFASAASAPELRATAVKFALRSLGGILLYAAAADLLRDAPSATRVGKALVAGALVAALAMIGEGHRALPTACLRPFHAQTFEVFGLVRASGPFQYPNIAAMYLETVLPLAFALGLPWTAGAAPARPGGGGRPPSVRPWRLAGTALVIVGLLTGVLVTASRAGLGTAAACLSGMGIFLARARPTRRAAVAAFAAVAMLLLASQLSGSPLRLRLAFWKDADWYRASLEPAAGPAGEMPASMPPAGTAQVTFQLRNLGALTWRRLPPTEVALSYHWLDAAGSTLVIFDGARTALPHDVPPGGVATVRATVNAPQRPGRYVLWWDLVHERATWFSQRGSPGYRAVVEVRGSAAPRGRDPRASASDGFRYLPSAVVPRRALWGAAYAAWRAHPLLGLGPDNFRHLYNRTLRLADPDDRLHANSLYFETMACLGTAGLLALAFVILALARAVRRAAARAETRGLAIGVGAGLCAVLVHGTFDYFLEFTPTYALFWLLGGMVVGLGRSPGEAAS